MKNINIHQNQYKYAQILVTPAMARAYLDSQEINRRILQNRVDQYRKAMEEGKFLPNGEAIKFDTEGRLIDGQHRLKAVIAYGRPVLMDCIAGIPSELISTLDSGRTRSSGDAIAILGLANQKKANAISSAARTLILAEAGFAWHVPGGGNIKYLSNEKVVSYAQNNPELFEIYDWIAEKIGFRHNLLPVGDVIALIAMGDRVDKELSRVMALKVLTGANLQDGSVELFLHNYLMKKTPNSQKKMTWALSWNRIRKGRTLKNADNFAWKKGSRVQFFE